MEDNPCEKGCFAVETLVKKLEEEVAHWKDEAEFWEKRAIAWRSSCAQGVTPNYPQPKKKEKARSNPGHLKLAE